ncbi:MAG: amidohydrolase [Candidatus Rokubacteria bacterium]|nr:amidohydrolase [Candidatus Rokubacteria bacterium]
MKAIDVHCHLSTQPQYEAWGKFLTAMERYYKFRPATRTEEEMVAELRRADVKACIIAWDAEAGTGEPVLPNDYVADLVRRFPDTFLGGWAMVDPWKGRAALAEAERALTKLGLLGIKFQATAQAFFPDDPRFYPLYDLCQSLGKAVQFHTGTTGFGAGMPGGMGLKLKYCRPIPHLDDVAADFPRLTIIACHPSWPWQDEMIAVVLHKANVHMEMSGWSPKYFTEPLKREIRGRLQDRVMFGSDYPVLGYERLFRDWESEGYPAEVLEKVYLKNAKRILGLGG